MSKDNLKLWNSVCETDPKLTKDFQGAGGFSGTAVCAQTQIKKATEMFGAFGIGWKIEDQHYEYVSISDDHKDTILVYNAVLIYYYGGQEGRVEIDSEIPLYFTKGSKQNDTRKKVRTDAITKALSNLGFNSDLFEGKFDDNRYIAEMKEKYKEKPKPQPKIAKKNLDALIKKATEYYGADEVEAKIAAWVAHYAVDKIEDITDKVGGEILKRLNDLIKDKDK